MTTVYFSEWEHAQASKGELSLMGLKFPALQVSIDIQLLVSKPEIYHNWEYFIDLSPSTA